MSVKLYIKYLCSIQVDNLICWKERSKFIARKEIASKGQIRLVFTDSSGQDTVYPIDLTEINPIPLQRLWLDLHIDKFRLRQIQPKFYLHLFITWNVNHRSYWHPRTLQNQSKSWYLTFWHYLLQSLSYIMIAKMLVAINFKNSRFLTFWLWFIKDHFFGVELTKNFYWRVEETVS